MTKYTATLRLPYPEGSEQPRGWEQIQALAEATDTAMAPYSFRAEASDRVPVPEGPTAVQLRPGGADWADGWTWETATGSWICPADGIYALSARIDWAVVGHFEVFVNEATSGGAEMLVYNDDYGRTPNASDSSIIRKGDKIQLWARSPDAAGQVVYCFINAVRIAPAPPPPANSFSAGSATF